MFELVFDYTNSKYENRISIDNKIKVRISSYQVSETFSRNPFFGRFSLLTPGAICKLVLMKALVGCECPGINTLGITSNISISGAPRPWKEFRP